MRRLPPAPEASEAALGERPTAAAFWSALAQLEPSAAVGCRFSRRLSGARISGRPEVGWAPLGDRHRGSPAKRGDELGATALELRRANDRRVGP